MAYRVSGTEPLPAEILDSGVKFEFEHKAFIWGNVFENTFTYHFVQAPVC